MGYEETYNGLLPQVQVFGGFFFPQHFVQKGRKTARSTYSGFCYRRLMMKSSYFPNKHTPWPWF